jgi:hypothetical protein
LLYRYPTRKFHVSLRFNFSCEETGPLLREQKSSEACGLGRALYKWPTELLCSLREDETSQAGENSTIRNVCSQSPLMAFNPLTKTDVCSRGK